MNRLKIENKVPFQFFALHRGGKKPQGEKIVADKSKMGDAWAIDFVWSTPDFEKQFGGVKGLPSYYVIGPDGRVRAVIKGHSSKTMETLTWLQSEIQKRT